MCLYKAAQPRRELSWQQSVGSSHPPSPSGAGYTGESKKERKKGRKKRPHSCHQSAAGDSVIQADSEKPVNRHSAAAAAIADVFKAGTR